MAKIITDKEMAEIITRAVNEDLIDDAEQYHNFLDDLAKVIGDHFGAYPGISEHTHDLGYSVAFRVSHSTPEDGGVFADYDKDVTWKDGKEEEM
jgi:sugar-specific transcriptional regulator TrmB